MSSLRHVSQILRQAAEEGWPTSAFSSPPDHELAESQWFRAEETTPVASKRCPSCGETVEVSSPGNGIACTPYGHTEIESGSDED